MRQLFCLLAFLVFFPSLVSASQVWHVATGGEITTKPVAFAGGVAVATSAGEVFLLNPTTGSVTWKVIVKGVPLQPVLSQNNLVVATTDGEVTMLGTHGSAVEQFDLAATENVTYVYGIDATASKVFLATAQGVFAIGTAGDVTNIHPSENVSGQITASGSSLIFNEGGSLVMTSQTGAPEWQHSVGGTWLSKPVVDGQSVYVGGLDDKLHALSLSAGIEKWSFDTGDWVLSTPFVENGTVYFGSNDGSVYALDQSDGAVRWRSRTPLAIETQPEPGEMGGDAVIFVGSTANSIYAIDAATGNIIWMGTVDGWVADPLFYQNHVIFGSADDGIYSYSTERACSITSPVEGGVEGYKEVEISGNSVSASGSQSVLVSVDRGQWQNANVSADGSWVYYVDPSATMASGLNTISCMVADSAGQENGNFTSITVTRDATASLSDFVPTTSGTGLAGDPLTIRVYDSVDGSPVDRFSAVVDGTSYFSAGNSLNVTIATAGTHTLAIKKMGYKDYSMVLSISSKGTSPVVIAVGAIVLIVAAWLVFTRVLRKK